MFNYFTEIDNIYLISGNKILVFKNDNLINTINHHSELTFIKYNYVFDKNKILYKITGNNLIEIFKFSKAISQITRNEKITYISNINSTIYQHQNNLKKLHRIFHISPI
ncbi:hypothetical protein SLOPH_684 [Spraguea lophii 42_110]|uniref:Uncharacterized protein n=1 Tax=Spraguea lophii (strain 42_110) TaxID=1358809 RepID=S7W4U8_SPRLO|nr:hypothetical protein SLOPH_684 [Spraguea lophii 42_110]